VTQTQPSLANEAEFGDLARALELLAERAPTMEPTELVRLWPTLELRVLGCLRLDRHPERGAASPETRLLRLEEERLRNLAWEIGVSVDLHAVHVGALRALAKLLGERGQRFASRGVAATAWAH
jgi:hypothetical protein